MHSPRLQATTVDEIIWFATTSCIILGTVDGDVGAMMEDLKWFGFEWQVGPDCGGPFGPYNQSERLPLHRAAFERLRSAG